SAKAVKEALRCGGVNVVASSKDENYSYIPARDTWTLDPEATYLHITSNNTIFGTQLRDEPDVDVPLVCDASSDFLSRRLDLDKYGLIYAGAQKNIGPAGVTVVLVKDDFLQTRKDDVATMLDYGTHAAKLFHTPPVFAVYLVEKVLAWLQEQGGIDGIAEVNARKAAKLYGAIDATDFYRGTVHPDARSEMNVCFRLPSDDLEATFLADAATHGLVALKGHRSVGGIRASIYNAVEEASVDALVAFMREFEQANG
ncbi:MAG: 3-phosphoserine/phosphohydroxythreonine transaminase, partial [Bacteroidota bacterium]